MIWGRTEGVREHPAIASYFENLKPFSKYRNPSRPLDRSQIRGYPLPPDPSQQRAICSPAEIERYKKGKDAEPVAGTKKKRVRKRGPFYKLGTRVMAR